MIRGGSWNNNTENCRTANRNRNNPDNRNNNVGFRLVFVPQLMSKAGWLLLNRWVSLLPIIRDK
ncbi:MAG: SUMF1/EgtB/PvdO family nonheme iron enzyme [Saprospiraceae bacterium]|nr:SUMF1/EgtB/PvdO family nonheme iron enzyme [Saprospiraceae bacterium]